MCRSNLSRNNGAVYSGDLTSSYFKVAANSYSKKPFEVAAPSMPFNGDVYKMRMSKQGSTRIERNSNSAGFTNNGQTGQRNSSISSEKKELKEIPRSISGILNGFLPLPRTSEVNSQKSSSQSNGSSRQPKMSQFAKYSHKPSIRRHQPSIQLGLSSQFDNRSGKSRDSQAFNGEYELPLMSEVNMSQLSINTPAASQARPSRALYVESLEKSYEFDKN